MAPVTAIITTFERPEACEHALKSVLGQEPRPHEILVCDDGSTDSTQERFEAWASRERRVRYLRNESNSGMPAVTRNLGVAAASEELVAFLDDDDVWLPGKLGRQLERIEHFDVIGTNAIRSDGGAYFEDAPALSHPRRADILAANPLILSSVVARKATVGGAGGFLAERWARGVEDYAMWLQASDRGARFEVLGEPFVRYESSGDSRLSAAPAHREVALARLAWRRALRAPTDPRVRRAALNRTVTAATLSWAAARAAVAHRMTST